MRSFYTFYQWWRRHSELRSIVFDVDKQIRSVLELNVAVLQSRYIKQIVLDVDGVLTPHGQTHLSPQISNWLNALHQSFSGNIFILTNNPYGDRLQYLQRTFPFLKIIKTSRKKPYPDGLLQVIADEQCEPNQVLMVDDRLATGCLAACIAGTQICWITEPLVDFSRHRFKEAFFVLLRKLDRVMIIK